MPSPRTAIHSHPWTDFLTDEAINDITANCPALTKLDTSFLDFLNQGRRRELPCTHIPRQLCLQPHGREALKAVATHCPSLTGLGITSCDDITDDGLRAIAANCPALSLLNALFCQTRSSRRTAPRSAGSQSVVAVSRTNRSAPSPRTVLRSRSSFARSATT